MALGECNKCNTKMKMSKCNKLCVAHAIVEDEKGKEYKVTVFNVKNCPLLEGGCRCQSRASTNSTMFKLHCY